MHFCDYNKYNIYDWQRMSLVFMECERGADITGNTQPPVSFIRVRYEKTYFTGQKIDHFSIINNYNVTVIFLYEKTLNFAILKFRVVTDGVMISAIPSSELYGQFLLSSTCKYKRNGGGIFAADGHNHREYVDSSSTHDIQRYTYLYNKKNGTRQTRVFIHLRIPTRNNFSSYILLLYKRRHILNRIPCVRSRAFPYRSM